MAAHLSAVGLLGGHVEVINKYEASLAGRWAKNALAPFVEPPLDLLLDCSSTGAGAQRHEDGHP